MSAFVQRSVARIALVAFAAAGFFAVPFSPRIASAAGTPPGTTILNQASASYTDGNNNAYNTLSNTVSTTVQNAPSLSIVAGTTQTIVQGGQLTDTFTVTNTGNGTGTFALTFGAQSGSDASAATVVAYQLTFPTAYTGTLPSGCTAVGATNKIFSCTTGANANSLFALVPVVAGGAVAVGVVYSASTTATTGTTASPQTIVTPLNGTITQSAANNPGSTGSATSTALTTAPTETDNVVLDARLDMQKAGFGPGQSPNSSGNIQYIIRAADGGGSPVHDLQSVKTLLGTSVAGVLITDKVPVFNSLPLQVQSTSIATSTANGFGATSTTAIYYTTSSNGTGGWTAYTSGSFPSGVTYVGVFISGGTNGIEFTANNGTTNGGSVTTAQAALSLTMFVTPPAGTGSGNANSAVNQADSVIGGSQPNPNPDPNVANSPQNAIGPGIPANTTDTSTVITTSGQGINYPNQTPGSNPTVGGASNTVGNNAPPSAVVLDGPYGVPGASGSYNGSVANTQNNDFSAVSFSPTGYTATNTSATGVVGNAIGTATTVNVPNTLQNNGNATDNLVLSLAAPTGWGVQIFAATNTGAPTGAALAGSTTSATATYTFNNVPSGVPTDTANQISYVAVYTAPATATGLTVYDGLGTVTSTNMNTQTNTTHNELIAGGPIALSKTSTLDGTTCPGGNAVPGCIINYAIAYSNFALPAASCPATAPSSVPTYQGGYYAKGVTLSENGKQAPSTWGATYTTTTGATANTTTGLNAAARDTTTGTTFTTNTAGSYQFAALIGGSSSYYVAPGCSGTIMFSVTVNTQ